MQVDLGIHRPGFANAWMLVVLALGALGATTTASRADPFNAEGYRTAPYRAPTPLETRDATTVHFAEDVRRLLADADVVAVNVSPITLGPRQADGTRPWLVRPDRPLRHIPGSVWLPNVGLAELEPILSRYFADNLARLGDGSARRGFLFYCQADCWMSWNAVRRASRELGYRNVYWYPFGIDGWREAGFPVEVAYPVPVPTETPSVPPTLPGTRK